MSTTTRRTTPHASGAPMRALVRATALLAAALLLDPARVAGQRLGGLDVLAVPAGARAVSLAEALTAAGTDLEAVVYNPAAVAGGSPAFAVSRADAPELYQHYLFAGGTSLRGIGDVATFARVLTFEPIPLVDEEGTPVGEASPQTLTVGVTAARRLLPALDAGVSIRFATVDLGPGAAGASGAARGSGLAFDRGALFRPAADLPLSLGAAILDLGPDLELGAGSDPLPTRLRLGLGLEPLALLRPQAEAPVRALLLFDREQGLAAGAAGAAWHFGAELRLLDLLALRGGLGAAGAGAAGTRQVFGLGVSLRRVRLDLAYELTDSPALDDQTHVSLLLRL